MKAPYGTWMLASRIWQRWPNAREALWMNFWIMFITFADPLAWTTTSPSSRLASIKNRPFQVAALQAEGERQSITKSVPNACLTLLYQLDAKLRHFAA